ncbi:flagella synthesis protein FlgN [Ectothiorhodospira magna]|uniref:Flagella synthesis protein FlgN n=1 Tax=Ectothiorhodospira magna TaxID=867345 RepID=A0A1H9DDN5_9GAMM|nr:flagellar protein FlgN [Ectothiorhodospira magna]SEQ11615.1 flagella synthesis protein FlgN [Ectothiorhodospira magna]
METRPFPEHLEQILTRSIGEASALEHALQREAQALGTRDVDALNAAVSEKQQRVKNLESLTQEQGALLKREGYENNAHGMACCLRDWDQEQLIQPVWDRLVDVISRCRELNLANGGVVEGKRRTVDQALHILRGEDHRTELYSASGRTTFSSGASRPITKA